MTDYPEHKSHYREQQQLHYHAPAAATASSSSSYPPPFLSSSPPSSFSAPSYPPGLFLAPSSQQIREMIRSQADLPSASSIHDHSNNQHIASAAASSSSSPSIDLTGDEELALQLQRQFDSEIGANHAQELSDAQLAASLASSSPAADIDSPHDQAKLELAHALDREAEARVANIDGSQPSYREQLRQSLRDNRKSSNFAQHGKKRTIDEANEKAHERAIRRARRNGLRERELRLEQERLQHHTGTGEGGSTNQWSGLEGMIETSQSESESEQENKKEKREEHEKVNVNGSVPTLVPVAPIGSPKIVSDAVVPIVSRTSDSIAPQTSHDSRALIPTLVNRMNTASSNVSDTPSSELPHEMKGSSMTSDVISIASNMNDKSRRDLENGSVSVKRSDGGGNSADTMMSDVMRAPSVPWSASSSSRMLPAAAAAISAPSVSAEVRPLLSISEASNNSSSENDSDVEIVAFKPRTPFSAKATPPMNLSHHAAVADGMKVSNGAMRSGTNGAAAASSSSSSAFAIPVPQLPSLYASPSMSSSVGAFQTPGQKTPYVPPRIAKKMISRNVKSLTPTASSHATSKPISTLARPSSDAFEFAPSYALTSLAAASSSSSSSSSLYLPPPDPSAINPILPLSSGNKTAGVKRPHSDSAGPLTAQPPLSKKQRKREKKAVELARQQQKLMMKQSSVGAPSYADAVRAANVAAAAIAGPRLTHAQQKELTYKNRHGKTSAQLAAIAAEENASPGTLVPASELAQLQSDWSDVRHVILLDLDNWIGFFKRLSYCFSDHVYLWVFHGANTIPRIPVSNVPYQHLRAHRHIQFTRCGARPDAADFALMLKLGELNQLCAKDIPFTLFSGDRGFDETLVHIADRRIQRVDPHGAGTDEETFALLKSISDT